MGSGLGSGGRSTDALGGVVEADAPCGGATGAAQVELLAGCAAETEGVAEVALSAAAAEGGPCRSQAAKSSTKSRGARDIPVPDARRFAPAAQRFF